MLQRVNVVINTITKQQKKEPAREPKRSIIYPAASPPRTSPTPKRIIVLKAIDSLSVSDFPSSEI